MNLNKALLLGMSLGIIAAGVGCGGSTYQAVTPPPPAFATTVSDLVKNHTSDTEAPASLDSLNLTGADVEDIHEFDPLLGIM